MPKDYLEASAIALNNEPKESIFTFKVRESNVYMSNYLVTVEYILTDKQKAVEELFAIKEAVHLAIKTLRSNA